MRELGVIKRESKRRRKEGGVVMWASVTGSMLPFPLRHCGLDPATSSAPFMATLVDVTGLFICVNAAFVVLRGTVL
jgi:magnesium transporter